VAHLVVAGGVAANVINGSLATVAADAGYQLHVPPAALCADNAAMMAGRERAQRG
jgi:N6-L-threonylcarbamoyladenine synthase